MIRRPINDHRNGLRTEKDEFQTEPSSSKTTLPPGFWQVRWLNSKKDVPDCQSHPSVLTLGKWTDCLISASRPLRPSG